MKIDGLKTLFIDIDGTLIHHHNIPNMQSKLPTIVLEGVRDKLIEWQGKGYKLILTTGRRESERKVTKQQLSDAGIQYDLLIMGINMGERVIINDVKEDSDEPTARAINVKRNEGFLNIDL